ncbi:MAG: hypothetical protein EXS16_05100 [Gemmataceae bacterium]|nr:hypothetical protein [Gemmataceae bacterium]
MNRRREIVAGKAKANQKEHGGTAPGIKKNTSGKIALSVPVNTRDELAKAAGVGARTYDAGVAVLEAAKNGTIAGATWRTSTESCWPIGDARSWRGRRKRTRSNLENKQAVAT